MRNYSWGYGLLHWVMHYILAIMLVAFSGIVIVPISFSFTFFGVCIKPNLIDFFIVIVISSLIDLDHMPVLRKFGARKYILAQKRLVSPLHNFFFLSVFAVASAFSAIFISKVLAVLIFALVLHLLWDIVEDVVIFKTPFRRWENTWGLKKKDIEETYDQVVKQSAKVLQIKPENKRSKKIKK